MQDRYSGYLDYHQRDPHADYLVEHRSPGSLPVRLLTGSQPAGEYPDRGTSDLRIELCLRGSA